MILTDRELQNLKNGLEDFTIEVEGYNNSTCIDRMMKIYGQLDILIFRGQDFSFDIIYPAQDLKSIIMKNITSRIK